VSQDLLPADSASYVFASFTLDTRFRRLLHNSAVVPLTTKAFDTLEVLVRSAGHTVTKDELLKSVWPGTFVQEDTLAQNISTIRRALGDSPDSPRFVLTVPREGYRFIAPVEVVHVTAAADGSGGFEQLSASPLRRPAARIQQWLPFYAAGAVSGLVLATVAFVVWRLATVVPSPPAMPSTSTTFEILEPEGTRLSTTGGMLAMAPDGRHVVFMASDVDGRDNLWIRPLDSLDSTRLPGTVNAAQPFWSADSRSVAFFSEGYLRRVDIAGGASRPICKVGAGGRAGSWSREDRILFEVNDKGLFQVSASGGTAVQLTVPGMRSCQDCLWPSFLPDGRRFLFTVVSSTPDRGIYVGSLDGAVPHRILEAVSSAMYTDPGCLFYRSAGALVARRFDPSDEQVTGDEVPVTDRVWFNEGTRRAVFSVSQTGLVAYREPQLTRLQWISRIGIEISTGPEGVHQSFSVSRDGRVLTSELDPRLGTDDIYLHDAALKARTRLTFDAASDMKPLWSADESRVVFAREGPNGWQLYDISLDKPGVERPLLLEPSPNPVTPFSWDGDVLVYGAVGKLWSTRPGRADRPVLIAETEPNSEQRVSPDWKWLAFSVNVAESRPSHRALYVRSWRGASDRWEIASEGTAPRWRSDSKELFFIAPGGRLTAQRVDSGRPIGASERLSAIEALEPSGVAGQIYESSADGQRFLVKIPARRPSIVVMSGWPHLQR